MSFAFVKMPDRINTFSVTSEAGAKVGQVRIDSAGVLIALTRGDANNAASRRKFTCFKKAAQWLLSKHFGAHRLQAAA